MQQETYSIESLIKEPLTVIDNILSKNVQQHGFKLQAVKDTEQQVKQLFETSFDNNNNWHFIPTLNTETYKQSKVGKHTLVRFRCMVQDMMDQEMFPGILRNGDSLYSSAMYRDEIESAQDNMQDEGDMSQNDFILSDRNVLYCVPIPGETQWAKQFFTAPNAIATTTDNTDNDSKSQSKKRARSDEEETNTDGIARELTQNDDQTIDRKRTKPDSMNLTNSEAPAPPKTSNKHSYSLDHPLPNETEISCIVKVCDNKSDSLKICEIIEVFGVLAENTSSFASEYSDPAEDDLTTVYPPQSLVPRIHCIFFKRYGSVHHPLADSSKLSVLRTAIPELRAATISYISQAFHGDKLVSEFFLLNLLSRIYARTGSLLLGKLILNITKCPATDTTFSTNVEKMVSSLVPSCHLLKLSPENLQRSSFIPRKNFSTNKLNAGLLQLPCGTHLLIDENSLAQGELKGMALSNMKHLQSVISQGILSYDFVYNTMEMPVDLNLCILSDGKSIFKIGINCFVPLVAEQQNVPISVSQGELDQMRAYISIMNSMNAGLLSTNEVYSINEEVSKMAETEFVEARNSKNSDNSSEQVTPETFHLWLDLARLTTLSFARMDLSKEMWNHMRQIEKARCARLAQYHPNSQ